MNLHNVSILLIVMLGCGCTTESEERNALELGAIEYLSSSDQSTLKDEGIFYLYQHFADEDLESLVKALWDLDKNKYPELNWQSIESDSVRLRVAFLRAQWSRETEKNEALIEEIKDYVTPFRKHANNDLRAHAVTFSVGLTKADADELQSIALNDKDETVATLAVLSLTNVEDIDVKRTLTDLHKRSESAWVKKKIEEVFAMKGLGKLGKDG